MAVVHIEGKPVTLDDEIVKLGKEAVRAALAVDFPGVENADIVIEEKGGRAPAITVSKRAAPKQAPHGEVSPAYRRVIEALMRAPDYVNPAIGLAAACQQAELRGDAEFFDRAARRGDVERAVAEGEREQRAVHKALAALGHAKPASSKTVPVGF
jgi:hypothetical protein